MPLPDFISKLFTGGAADLIKSVSGVVDEFHMSPEEKEQLKQQLAAQADKHMQEMEALALEETQSYLKDNESARQREIAVVTGEHVPLINKIITPILALIVILATFTIWALILFRHYEPKVNEAIIIGALTTICGGVVNYYFGSSAGSERKQKQIEELTKK